MDNSSDVLSEIRKNIDKTARIVVQYMIENNLTLSSAESCTGGMLSAAVTSVPGASAVFECGIVSYSERIKSKILGVPARLIKTFGVVSREVAESMAENVMKMSDSDVSVGITGLAGPSGDGVNPVGTIFVSVRRKGAYITKNLALEKRQELPCIRDIYRAQAVLEALLMIKTALGA